MNLHQMSEIAIDSFKKYCNPRENTVVLTSDDDGDGLSCASSINYIFLELFGEPPTHYAQNTHTFPWSEPMCNEISQYKPDSQIAVDVPYYPIASNLAKNHIFIDHHVQSEEAEKNVIMLNSNDLEGINIRRTNFCAGMICHNISKLGIGKTHPTWKSWLAVVNDNCDQYFPDFSAQIRREHPLYDKNDFIKMAKLVNYPSCLHKDIRSREKKYTYELFLEADEPDTILNDHRLNETYSKVNRTIEYYLRNWKKRTEFSKVGKADIAIYRLDTDMDRIHSSIATEISRSIPKTTLIVIGCIEDGHGRLSLRNRSGSVNVGKLAYLCSKEIGNGSVGGGLDQASGMSLKKEDLEKGIDAIIENLPNFMNPDFYS